MPTLGARVDRLERDIHELRDLIVRAMEDPQSLPLGRQAAREHEAFDRRLVTIERELRRLIAWASGATSDRGKGRRAG